jgi:hypothetical protein
MVEDYVGYAYYLISCYMATADGYTRQMVCSLAWVMLYC